MLQMASSSVGVCEQGRLEDETKLGGPVFNPRLYKQRYNEIVKIARRMQARKVVDMGCAECKLLQMLKREQYIEQLYGVDFDPLPLRLNDRIVYPLTTDYLMPREKPLHVSLMQGSIAEPDSRLMNLDLFSCVEVIEHLDPDVLDRVPRVVFGILRPKVVVVTTPNSEFNVLFPGFSGFRHHDHRFEWTRKEFESWCNEITTNYNYTVDFGGVGAPPEGKEEVGCCSQMATFTLVQTEEGKGQRMTSDVATPYNVISSADHPFVDHPLSPIQKLCHEAEYYLHIVLRIKRDQILENECYFDEPNSSQTNMCREEQVGTLNVSDDNSPTPEVKDGVNNNGLTCSRDQPTGNNNGIACSHDQLTGNSNTIYIKLTELLKFPRITALCTSTEEIRDALQLSSSVQLDSTGTCAVYSVCEEEFESESEDEDEVERGEPIPSVEKNEVMDIGETEQWD